MSEAADREPRNPGMSMPRPSKKYFGLALGVGRGAGVMFMFQNGFTDQELRLITSMLLITKTSGAPAHGSILTKALDRYTMVSKNLKASY